MGWGLVGVEGQILGLMAEKVTGTLEVGAVFKTVCAKLYSQYC